MEHSRWLRVNTLRWIFLIRLSVFRYECLLDRMHIPTNTDGCLQRILHENWMRWDEIVLSEQEDSASVKEMQWCDPQYRDIFFNSRIARYVCGNAFYSVHSPISSYRSNYLLDFFLHSFPLSLFLSLFTHFKFHLFGLFLLYTFLNLLLASNRKIIANEIENGSTTRMKLHFIIKFLWHIDGKLNWRHRNAQRLTPSARNINEREGETRSECNAFNAVRSI